MLRRKLLWISSLFLLALGAAGLLGGNLAGAATTERLVDHFTSTSARLLENKAFSPARSLAGYATLSNVTLVSFTAQSFTSAPEVYVAWETATEIDTAGFYVQRSLTSTADSYTRVSPFIPAEGDSVTGALYDWVDDTTTLNTTYSYRLLEILTDAAKQPIPYGAVWVTAGVASTQVSPASPTATRTPTQTPTPTQTSTPTRTPTSTPTSTSTTRSTTPVPTNPPIVTATPHLASGATITPRPPAGNVAAPLTSVSVATQASLATPTVRLPSPMPATTLPAGLPTKELPLGSEPPAPTLAAPSQVPDQTAPSSEIAAAPAALVPTAAALDAVEPVVVVTEAATPAAKPAESRGGGLLLIIGAAVFLLVGAFLLLRQASK